MILTCPASPSSWRPGKLQVTPRGRHFRHPQRYADITQRPGQTNVTGELTRALGASWLAIRK
jgi:hypothetical protein